MNRIHCVVAALALALASGTASAGFIGIDIREDKDMTNAPAGARTFNFYAQFDGNGIVDTVLSVGQPDTTSGFGINTTSNPNADFYQEITPILNTNNDTAPPAGFLPISPTFAFDTYVDIGLKVDPGTDTTTTDPDFGFVDSDLSGGDDFITGGWFNSNPPGLQGAADGNQETFIAQVTIIGLDGAADLGSLQGQKWVGSVFTGGLTIFRQGDVGGGEDPAVGIRIDFSKIPTPGSLALFGIAGFAATLRRR